MIRSPGSVRTEATDSYRLASYPASGHQLDETIVVFNSP